MWQLIERLRQKNPGAKRRIALLISGTVTVIIFLVWISVLHFGQPAKDGTASVANASKNEVNPISAFGEVFSTGWSSLMRGMGEAKAETDKIKKAVTALSTTTGSTSTTESVVKNLISTFKENSGTTNREIVPVPVSVQKNVVKTDSNQGDSFVIDGSDNGSITQ